MNKNITWGIVAVVVVVLIIVISNSKAVPAMQENENGGATTTTAVVPTPAASPAAVAVPAHPAMSSAPAITIVANPIVMPVQNPNSQVKVIFPSGGGIFPVGQKTNIAWKTTGIGSAQSMNIYLIKQGDSMMTTIAKNVLNTGSYPWTVPATPGAYFIVVDVAPLQGVDSINNTNSDSNDSAFTIK